MNETTNESEFAKGLAQYHEWLKTQPQVQQSILPWKVYYESKFNRVMNVNNAESDNSGLNFIEVDAATAEEIKTKGSPWDYKIENGRPVYKPETEHERLARTSPEFYEKYFGNNQSSSVPTVPGHAALPLTDQDKK